MPPLILEVWDDLYQARALRLRWALRRRDWMISASTRAVDAETHVWMRLDHPDRPPALKMLRFSHVESADAYLQLRQQQLRRDGWIDI
jgi:hypothetical protein